MQTDKELLQQEKISKYSAKSQLSTKFDTSMHACFTIDVTSLNSKLWSCVLN